MSARLFCGVKMSNIHTITKNAARLINNDNAQRAENGTLKKNFERKKLEAALKDMPRAIAAILHSRMQCGKETVYIKSLFFDAQANTLRVNGELFREKITVEIARVAERAPLADSLPKTSTLKECRIRYAARYIKGVGSQYFLDCLIDAVRTYIGNERWSGKAYLDFN